MQKNVGGMDRTLRIIVGVALIVAAFIPGVPWWIGLIGLVPLATGTTQVCPLYPMIGCNTNKGAENAAPKN